MKRVGSIYMITNTVTQEQYVGLTRQSIAKRWSSHCGIAFGSTAKKYKLHQAIAQYGKHAFVIQELFVAFDLDGLSAAEIEIIAAYKPVYNTALGGSGFRTHFVPDHIKLQRSEAAKKRWANPEWREKTRLALHKAAQTEAARLRGKDLAKKGNIARWSKHTKKEKTFISRSEVIKRSWQNPETRQKRIQSLKATFSADAFKQKRHTAMLGVKMPKVAVEKSAKAKWKPIYCEELQVSFLCQKYAAEFLNVLSTSVSNAIKNKGKVLNQYTFVRVA